MAGGDDAFKDSLLPQLLPIFSCPPELRSTYGCTFYSHPEGPHDDTSPGEPPTPVSENGFGFVLYLTFDHSKPTGTGQPE